MLMKIVLVIGRTVAPVAQDHDHCSPVVVPLRCSLIYLEPLIKDNI